LERIYAGESADFIYARDGHPNARSLAEKLARLEGAESAMIVSSGMAAIAASLFSVLKPGDRTLIGDVIYGRTLALAYRLNEWGVDVATFDPCDDDAVRRAFADKRPRVVLIETLTNPLVRRSRIETIAPLSRAANAVLIVDSTFTPPCWIKPLSSGADLVVHSLTKFVSGHGDVTLGSIAGSAKRIESIRPTASMLGMHAAAADCWLTERSLATLDVRWNAACRNALTLAERLGSLSGVERVHYPGLIDHPDHEYYRSVGSGFGHMAAFELAGGRERVNRFIRELEAVEFLPSLGDARTSISHPATTSHRGFTPERRGELGIGDGLVRLSVGVEPIDPIADDLSRAIERSR
jgi:cystathionine beta-lyase/cystathionine gamma-synthase